MAAKPSTLQPRADRAMDRAAKRRHQPRGDEGQISVPEAARKYGFTQNENHRCADEYHRALRAVERGVARAPGAINRLTCPKSARSVQGPSG